MGWQHSLALSANTGVLIGHIHHTHAEPPRYIFLKSWDYKGGDTSSHTWLLRNLNFEQQLLTVHTVWSTTTTITCGLENFRELFLNYHWSSRAAFSSRDSKHQSLQSYRSFLDIKFTFLFIHSWKYDTPSLAIKNSFCKFVHLTCWKVPATYSPSPIFGSREKVSSKQ